MKNVPRRTGLYMLRRFCLRFALVDGAAGLKNITTVLIIFIMAANVYAVGRVEKRFDHSEYAEFFVSVSSKEELIDRLETVVAHVKPEDDGVFIEYSIDSIFIEYKMFPLMETVMGNKRFAYVSFQGRGDAQFYFDIAFDEDRKLISLIRSGYSMLPLGEDLLPGEVDMPVIFRQSIVDFLNNNIEIPFVREQAVTHTEFELSQIVRADIFNYNSHFSQWFSPQAYSIVPIEDRNSIERLYAFDWIKEQIQFPSEYQWYRYPEMMIVCQYQLGDEVVEAEKNKAMEEYYEKEREIDRNYKGEEYETAKEVMQVQNRTRMEADLAEAGRRNFMISIWQNGNQCFCQLSANSLFYNIDIERLQSILVDKLFTEN
jgi:hypothetical protein